MKIFVLIVLMILPSSMLLWGYLLKKNCPKEINDVFGYRTSMSTKNTDTWQYANTEFGKLWIKISIPIFIISVILFFVGFKMDNYGTIVMITMVIQLLFLIFPIVIMEKKLKKVFDKNGKRK